MHTITTVYMAMVSYLWAPKRLSSSLESSAINQVRGGRGGGGGGSMKELWPLEENKYKWSNVASIYHKIN